ncbi:MAG: aminopeptidase [Bacilli bacterium]|nr:aminopeptidase [Bacilli bacterium]
MKKSILKSYAKLIVRTGVAVKKGQPVLIKTNVTNEEFTAMVVEECYKAGATKVVVEWGSEAVARVNYKHGKEKYLSQLTPMQIASQHWQNDELPCMIWLDCDDPDGMAGLDMEKVARVSSSLRKQIWPIRVLRENKYQWCIAACPSEAWAKKVFPELSKKKAVEALWAAILECSRAADGNGIANWDVHNENFRSKFEYLNSLDLRELKYKASNGTDLKVGLIPNMTFLGGGENTLGGIFFQPNIPSEEVFTTPMRGVAEGIVYSSKPLSYNGVLIENFSVRFHEGKAVEVHAEKGEEALKSILTIDEGSAYLGECAFVPYESPINQTGLLFYNTLFDENAACHLALGRGFSNLYKDFEKYTEEELKSFGVNDSSSHVDFMIGTRDMSIIGVDANGVEHKIFENGTWAF